MFPKLGERKKLLGTVAINGLLLKTGSDRCSRVVPSFVVDDVERMSNEDEAACVYWVSLSIDA